MSHSFSEFAKVRAQRTLVITLVTPLRGQWLTRRFRGAKDGGKHPKVQLVEEVEKVSPTIALLTGSAFLLTEALDPVFRQLVGPSTHLLSSLWFPSFTSTIFRTAGSTQDRHQLPPRGRHIQMSE
jgi:hypothetical protein